MEEHGSLLAGAVVEWLARGEREERPEVVDGVCIQGEVRGTQLQEGGLVDGPESRPPHCGPRLAL